MLWYAVDEKEKAGYGKMSTPENSFLKSPEKCFRFKKIA